MWLLKISAMLVVLGLSARALACDAVPLKCQERFGELVAYRAEAIELAFGELLAVLPERMAIKFVGPRDAEYEKYERRIAYDIAQQRLIVPRHMTTKRLPNPVRAAGNYWPFYQNELYRNTFPVVLAIDNALWGAYLQEAAHRKGLSWPHAECASIDIGQRLPCEMLVEGIAAYLTAARNPFFNANRLDRIWPSDFETFRERVWRRNESGYRDVQRYGGLMLVKPLIDEFGAPNALYYFAQTPFALEEENLHLSALRYQERARTWLEANKRPRGTLTVVSSQE